jgi:hypothetical protein
VFVGPALTVNVNESAEGLSVAPTIITNSGGTHGNLYGLKVNALEITDTGGTITNATSLFVAGAPTEATNNFALWVDSGTSRFDGSGTSGAPVNIPHGSAPSSPVNGDVWTTTAGLFVRVNGSTVGPLTA